MNKYPHINKNPQHWWHGVNIVSFRCHGTLWQIGVSHLVSFFAVVPMQLKPLQKIVTPATASVNTHKIPQLVS